MKGSRTRLRKVLPEREREEAAVPEVIERLTAQSPTRRTARHCVSAFTDHRGACAIAPSGASSRALLDSL
jgi:hypothetical protein